MSTASSSNRILLTPLSGAHSEGPLCYVLQMGDVTILLDCGWDDHFNTNDSHIQELIKIAPNVDIVLLSHSDVYHVGALPYLVGQMGLLKKAKIFGTLPLVKMGQMTLYDLYQSYEHVKDFDVYDLDHVDAAFDSITQLKYSQRYPFKTGEVITIAPYNAGRTLGGTIWKISKEMDEIVYAVDINDKRERHLNATALESLGRPSILITDAYNAQMQNMYKTNRKPDSAILELVTSTLRNGGNVLLPVDSSQRALELPLVLENKWRSDRNMRTYPLFFLSTMAYRTVEFASHQLEWMSDNVMKGFDERRENPFEFKHLRMIHSTADLRLNEDSRTAMPTVVLATYNSLETGFARELLVHWSRDPKNLILTTDRASPHSLARKIIDSKLTNDSTTNMAFPLTVHRRIPLTGRELYEYQQNKAKEKQKEKEQENRIQFEDMDERIEEEGEVFVDTLRLPHDGDDEYGDKNELKEIKRHVRESQKKRNRKLLAESGVDMSGGKQLSSAQFHDRLFLPENMRYYSTHLMFPCIERTYEYDEYGERVDVNELKNRSLQLYEEDMNRLNEGRAAATDKKPDQDQEQEEIPTKSISENITVHLLCRLEFVNFEGRVDALSVRNILRQIAPRKIVLVHGDKNATKELQSYCIDHKISETVEAPGFQQTIDVTIDTNLFTVKLEPELFTQPFIQLDQQSAYELMYVEGKYMLNEDEQRRRDGVDDDILLDEEVDEQNMPSMTADPRGHDSILIGDVRLNQFYDVLVRNGFRPEFRVGGCLVCGENESIMLKRDADTGTIIIEGSMSRDYVRVRKLLYEQYKFI